MMSVSNQQNLAAWLHGVQDLRLEESECSKPRHDEVTVAVQACGLCGTDLHMWSSGQIGEDVIQEPFILGHESSGEVVACGSDVNRLKIGDQVALELDVPCRTCDLCKRGKYNLCKGFSHGSLARYRNLVHDFCHKLPDNLSYEQGALLEPLAVAVHACRRGGVQIGCKVLVGGAGPIGLSVVLAAKAMGAATVCITDLSATRLDLAKKFGADQIVIVEDEEIGEGRTDDRLARRIIDVIGSQVDVSVECTGTQSSLRAACDVTKRTGCLVPVGFGKPEVQLRLLDTVVRREVDIRGSFSYTYTDYQAAISLVSNCAVDPSAMITTRLTLQETETALNTMKDQDSTDIKIMIDCSK